MGGSKLFVGSLLLVILLSSIWAEASICETRSQFFKGACFKSDNCNTICEKEGYIAGRCRGFLRRCICAKDCGDGKGGADDPPADDN